jgi:hypothetical protein
LAAEALPILHTPLLSAPELLNCSIPAAYNHLATAGCSIVIGKIHKTSALKSTHLPRIPKREIVMAAQESSTAIMLDQAQVDAAEAAQAAQENGGEDGEYIGRRPSSSGRDSKRYRKY